MRAKYSIRALSYCWLALLTVGCGPGSPVAKVPTDTTNVARTISPDTPDYIAHYAPLLSFFQRHKHFPAFDTAISFADQGFGPLDNYYNFMLAGHIFSSTHIHALLWYDVGIKENAPLARLLICKKENEQWLPVLDDTLSVSNFDFIYRDWNSDGIRDLSLRQDGWAGGGHGPITWQLWLTGHDGHLHKVQGFEALDDPAIDSLTGHIFTRHIQVHNYVDMQGFTLSGHRLVKLPTRYVQELGSGIVGFYRSDKLLEKRPIKPHENIYIAKYDDDY